MTPDSGTPLVRYDPASDTYRTTHDFDDHPDVCPTLIDALETVAATEGIRFTEPLYKSVDPDGVRRFLKSASHRPRNTAVLTFTHEPFTVCIRGTGEIAITPTVDDSR